MKRTIADRIIERIVDKGLTEARVEHFLDLTDGSSVNARRATVSQNLRRLEAEGRLPVPRVVPKQKLNRMDFRRSRW